MLAPRLRADIRLNELMFHPKSELDRDEWLELFNTGVESVDVSGWRFTTGVRFVFPPESVIAPGGFLVVAADRDAFTAQHPGVTAVVGNWSGHLSNSGQQLELQDAQGRTIESIRYADQGDWAQRVLGPSDRGHRGWDWSSAADGHGASLELVQAALPGAYGQNWSASLGNDGTPGLANSVANPDAAPLILGVSHLPLIPHPGDSVTVSAQLLDEAIGVTAQLHWRADGDLDFVVAPMYDDGLHGDRSPADGRFGAIVPPHPDGTVIEFYVEARDAAGHIRYWPAPGLADGAAQQVVNAMYQVDGAALADPRSVGELPMYRLILTETNRIELDNINRNVGGSAASHALFNATFIALDAGGASVRYNVGVRNRGNGSAARQPQSFRINFRHDERWQDVGGLNLNTQYTPAQLLGSALYRKAGLPAANSSPVRVRVNGQTLSDRAAPTYGFYVANEVIESDYAARAFPADSSGNIYRGIRLSGRGADLHDEGSDPAPYRLNYFKRTNSSQDDWSDLIHLCQTLSDTKAPVAEWADAVRRAVDIEEWMLYFAIETFVDNKETNLANGNNGTGQGDDYFLYFGLGDPRARVIPYDLDTIVGVGDSTFNANDGLFRMNANPVVARFMQHPEFAAVYYRTLQRLMDGPCSAGQLDRLIDEVLGGLQVDTARQVMKQFSAARRTSLEGQIPRNLSATNATLARVDGTYVSTTPELSLSGRANAATTYAVRVNGQPAVWSQWEAKWASTNVTLNPGLNALRVEALDAAGQPLEVLTVPVRFDDGSVAGLTGSVSGTRSLKAADGPYRVTGVLTIAAGATLDVEPGTCFYLGSGAQIVVADGGRIRAEGTELAPIQFSREPGSTASWDGIVLNGSVGSPQTRLAHVHFEGNGTTCIEVSGGTLFLDHATFGTTTHRYLALDGASFEVSDCTFPTSTAPFELVHGTKGIKAGGHGIVRHCYFGTTSGYNDIVDFTGGNRELGQPIIQFYNNVFMGASDDILDFDGTDAWVEGNIFLHVHQNGAPDSSSAVSGGSDSAHTSEVTLIGNLFFDCDQAATAKEGNFFTLLNNTIVRITRQGGNDSAAGVVNVRDFPSGGSPTAFGRGFYLEGNVVSDVEQLVRNYDGAQTTVTWNRNLLPQAWVGPGTGNIVANPLLRHVPTSGETDFATWEEAQILWEWLALQPGSPALGTGPIGRDMGGVVPPWVSISGEPSSVTSATSAILQVGPSRAGDGIPLASWPDGAGYTHYRWSLDNGPWSAEVPTPTPITLENLAPGTHQVRVVGRRDSGFYQDAAVFGDDAGVTLSRPWTVDPQHVTPDPAQTVRLNELLARNATYPANPADLIELHNPSGTEVDLAGYSLAQSPNQPRRFVFPAFSTIPSGGFLVVRADADFATPGLHTGFGLSQSGDAVYLYDAGTNLLDVVVFGLQLADLSVGRVTAEHDGRANPGTAPGHVWTLCEPTFGAPNVSLPTGDPGRLQLTEWLAAPAVRFAEDFIELHNPEPVPVALGGCFFTDNPFALIPAQEPLPTGIAGAGSPPGTRLPPLSFIAANAYAVFKADGQTQKGADHLGLALDADSGTVALYETAPAPEPSPGGVAPDWQIASLIDYVNYGAQYADVSQGRSAGSTGIHYFAVPTPGISNPAAPTPGTNVLTANFPLIEFTNQWSYWQKGDPGVAWRQGTFDDSKWPTGRAAFWYLDNRSIPLAFATNTLLTKGQTTFYFRTHFQLHTNAPGLRLNAEVAIDDGAAFWLNGELIHLLRLGAGATHNTAGTRIGTPILEGPFGLGTNGLRLGDNVLAIEVHESSATSSDAAFGVRLWASITQTNAIGELSAPPLMNEILANNRGLREGDGRFPDWIELYNPNDSPYPLEGLSFTDDLEAPRQFVFPPTAHIPAKGYFRIRCLPVDNVDECEGLGGVIPPGVDAPLGLKKTGESLYLLDTPARGGALLDSVTFGPVPADLTLARVPDGSPVWQLATPTLLQPNQAIGLGDPMGVRINEWMASPASGDDWFELFNPDDNPVELSRFHLTDELADPFKHTLPANVFIAGHGHLVFHADNNPTAGADHVGFKLAGGGEALGLADSDGVLVDSITFGAQANGVSEGRLPDGASTIVTFPGLPTPGLENPVDADQDGIEDGWEIGHGLSSADPADANLDPDRDGMDNRSEFIAGTDPGLASSVIRLSLVRLADGVVLVGLRAEADRAYHLESRQTLDPSDWTQAGTVEARSIARHVTLRVEPAATENRYFRVRIERR